MLEVGIDILNKKRIKKILKKNRHRFINRILTPYEISILKSKKNQIDFISGRFCAKEAIAKALHCGIGTKFSFLDISIINNESGAPIVVYNSQRKILKNVKEIKISISHCKKIVNSVAIVIKK